MIDQNFKDNVVEVIKEWFQNSGFKARKLTDTPTDDLQVVNKKYVDAHGASPAGNDTEIQYNNAGSFGSSSKLTWNNSLNTLDIGTAGSTGVVAAPDSSDNTAGGSISVQGGLGGTSGNGGGAQLAAGNAGTSSGNGHGGGITLLGGAGHVGGDGGAVTLQPGAAGSIADDGSVIMGLQTESATGDNGNMIYITTRNGAPTGTPTAHTGRIAMTYDRANNKLYIYNSGWKSVTLT